MPIKHSLLSGADLHEPKGIETASSGTVYTANGAGSGSWSRVASLAQGPTIDANDSTPGYFLAPTNCRLTSVSLILKDVMVTSEPSLTLVVKDSSGVVVGTVVFPAASDQPGTAMTSALNTALSVGGYVTVEVSGVPATSSCRIGSAFVVEHT